MNRFECNFGDNCPIDVLRRKFCKKCRLKKCFDMGMKKEYILNDEMRKRRQNMIQENRLKRKLVSETAINIAVDSTTYKSCKFDHSIDAFANHCKSGDQFNDTNNDYEEILVTYSVPDYIYDKAVELEFWSVDRPVPQNSSFNDQEMCRLSELFGAINLNPMTKITSDYQIDIVQNFMKKSITGQVISKLFAVYLEQIVQKNVKISKHITAFGTMCESDQIALIKYGSIEICFLRSILYYNFQCEYWTLILDDENSVLFNLDLFREHKKNTYYNHKVFLKKMAIDWDMDCRIIDLMTAILLFNPDRPNIVHKEAVKFQQHVYMHLLKKYLQIKYGTECESRTKFLKLLNCLQDLYLMNDKIAKNLVDGDPDRRMPLMHEICDRNWC
ncbi:unnamed protein product [Medioppia subpectinata]|uniref:Uncharacterized protein n=1 Tax=Medioppia subpectinata TaxID=1979941 RepID=A0A7R9KBC8_9ACAR|nr:unnamed protein product [Medioppia subpectinata]CAG2100060.1 unnamed protein product [Medioppia subpectinata]